MMLSFLIAIVSNTVVPQYSLLIFPELVRSAETDHYLKMKHTCSRGVSSWLTQVLASAIESVTSAQCWDIVFSSKRNEYSSEANKYQGMTILMSTNYVPGTSLGTYMNSFKSPNHHPVT